MIDVKLTLAQYAPTQSIILQLANNHCIFLSTVAASTSTAPQTSNRSQDSCISSTVTGEGASVSPRPSSSTTTEGEGLRSHHLCVGVASARIFREHLLESHPLARLVTYLDLSVMLHDCTHSPCIWKETVDLF